VKAVAVTVQLLAQAAGLECQMVRALLQGLAWTVLPVAQMDSSFECSTAGVVVRPDWALQTLVRSAAQTLALLVLWWLRKGSAEQQFVKVVLDQRDWTVALTALLDQTEKVGSLA
jgi:hypothetical protein